MRKLTILAWLLIMFTCIPSWAVKVKSLFEVQMSVASQASDARAEAIREGFQEVLIRLTGNQDISKNKVLKSSLNRADYFVQEYSYSSPSVNASTYTLNIKYNQQDIARLLRKAGATSWGDTRPLVLVWFASVNDKHEADILGTDTTKDSLAKFKRIGQRFGVPLIFPVMDVEDMDKVSPSNITSLALPILQMASRRYQPDVLLIGTIERDADAGYQGRWSLVWKDKSWEWNINGVSQEKVFADVLNNVIQVLSQRGQARTGAELSQK